MEGHEMPLLFFLDMLIKSMEQVKSLYNSEGPIRVGIIRSVTSMNFHLSNPLIYDAYKQFKEGLFLRKSKTGRFWCFSSKHKPVVLINNEFFETEIPSFSASINEKFLYRKEIGLDKATELVKAWNKFQ